MALPNPSSLVTALTTLTLTDILQSAAPTVLNRINLPIGFKAVNVQYQGYFNILPNSATTFGPLGAATTFAVVYVRNAGPSNVAVGLPAGTPVINLDTGAMFLYISPLLSSILISAVSPGFTSVGITTSVSTQASVELLLAG
jgi:hypothetical protein